MISAQYTKKIAAAAQAQFEADQQKLPEAQREAWESASQEVKTSYMRKANQAATGPKGGSKVVTIL